jgi:ribosomal protein S3AE
MVLGKIASDIYNESKLVAPLRHVGIRKSKLIGTPAGPIEQAPLPEPEVEATPVEEEAEA